MSRFQESDARWSFELLSSLGLANACELGQVRGVLAEQALGDCLELAESIHLHVKVEDTSRLPRGLIESAGGVLDHAREGFVKFLLPGAVNAIFSHIPVAAEDLREGACGRRPRPFLDHIGIDVRRVNGETRAAFDALPGWARANGWAHVPQGGPDRAVRCCHVEVAEKHWLYRPGAASRPIEVAFGPLRQSENGYGCDLRPAHPALAPAAAPACCPG